MLPLEPSINKNKIHQITNQFPQHAIAFNAYRLKTKLDLLTFYGGAAGWPTKRTWIKAINNGSYASWPGLTAPMVYKHYYTQIPTIMGHMHARRSGIRNTKTTPAPAPIMAYFLLDEDNDSVLPPTKGILNTTDRKVGAHILASSDFAGKISTDFCGRFPHTSSRGMKYIFILYCYDSNLITAAPTKSR